jgi:hypothetical protein
MLPVSIKLQKALSDRIKILDLAIQKFSQDESK